MVSTQPWKSINLEFGYENWKIKENYIPEHINFDQIKYKSPFFSFPETNYIDARRSQSLGRPCKSGAQLVERGSKEAFNTTLK